jgi:hypothetical protein
MLHEVVAVTVADLDRIFFLGGTLLLAVLTGHSVEVIC